MDNVAQKVDKCPLTLGRQVLFVYNWRCKSCPLYRVAACPLFRGCLSIEGKSGLLELSVILWVSAVEGVSVKWFSTVGGKIHSSF